MRNHTIPKSALMRAYEEGYLSAHQDLQRSYDAGWTEGYHTAWEEWADFVDTLPDALFEQMRSFIITTARDMLQHDEPPF